MYSPTKQARDQDPEGLFIRRWCPELTRVPLPYLSEPWKMDISVQRMAGCFIGTDYPAPVVDEKAALKRAKDRMYGLRKTDEAREEAGAVQARHGSRKSGLPPSGQRRKTVALTRGKRAAEELEGADAQGDLFG
jgi:deoxyribodipyrimidine photo-lyase